MHNRLLWVIDGAWLNENIWLKVGVRDTGMIWIEAFMRVRWLVGTWFNDNLRLKVSVRSKVVIRVDTWVWMSNRTVDDAEAWIHNFWENGVYNGARLNDNLWLDWTDFRIVRARLNDT